MYTSNITSAESLENIYKASYNKPQLIFKHSTRCSISVMAKARLEKSLPETKVETHYLDLLTYRQLSNLIAEKYNVHHESPQVLLIKNGECIYDESHGSIYMDDVLEMVSGEK
jgi:bacillithiol system protein YtxJ